MPPTLGKTVAVILALFLATYLSACGDVGGPAPDATSFAPQVSALKGQVIAVSPLRSTRSADYNADGFADLVLRNSASGDLVLWSMNGAAVAADPMLGTVANATWKIVGRGDFDGNGRTDLLWQNRSNGDVAIWSSSVWVVYDGAGISCGSDLRGDTNPGYTPSFLACGVFAQEVDQDWRVTGVGDFSNDGKADIVWRNVSTGDVRVWLMNGRAIAAEAIVRRVSDPAWRMTCVADFDGDGRSDLLWRNVSTGDNAIWLMNGAAISGSPVFINQMKDQGWRMVGAADFDGDGKADILWRNYSTGDVALWFMNGTTRKSESTILRGLDTLWKVVGVDDYNNDGFADIFWRLANTGQTSVTTMNGSTMTSASGSRTLTDLRWNAFTPCNAEESVIGNADYDGDGKSDMLWRNDDGTIAMWLMDGATPKATPVIGKMGAAWKVASSGDYDGDGNNDMLWRNDDGSIAMWLMNGATPKATPILGTMSTAWTIASSGDYDGDGKSDILWRKDDGTISIWFMNGATPTTTPVIGAGSTAAPTSVPAPGAISTAWKVASSGDYDGDGKSDILWRNDDGSIAMWLMNGATPKATMAVGKMGTAWKIASSGDYNSDGKSDILWRNDDGTIAMWLMDRWVPKSTPVIGTMSTSWKIVDGSRDYNGDAKSDILWRNDSGTIAVWLMDEATPRATPVVGRMNADWKLALTSVVIPPPAINLDFQGPYPAPGDVTYTQKDGTSVNVTAYSGQVIAFFDTTTPAATAIRAIESFGAKILAQMPDYGYYLVAVTPGSEGRFISSIVQNTAVLDALPHGFDRPAIAARVDGTTAGMDMRFPMSIGISSTVIDCFGPDDTHGDTVTNADQSGGGNVGLQVDVSPVNGNVRTGCSRGDGIPSTSIAKAIWLTSRGNEVVNPGRPTLINISLSGGPNDHDSAQKIDCMWVGIIRNATCNVPWDNAQQQKDSQDKDLNEWEASLRAKLWNILVLPASQRKNVLVFLALGNGSMDVSTKLDELRKNSALAEILDKNVILVGAANDRIAKDVRASGTYSNIAANGERDVVNYRGLINSATGALLDAGTSFASPRVEAIAEQVIKAVPGLTTEQIVQAVKRADELPGGLTLAGATNEAQSIKNLAKSGAAIGISGKVTNNSTGAALGGAKLLIESTNGTFIAFSSANGTYTLSVPVSLRDQTASVIMQASSAGFVPRAVPVNFSSSLTATANVALTPIGSDTILVGTDLHHLGDSLFSTALNAGLQLLKAEGTSLSRAFTVDVSQLPPQFTKATLTYAVNGAECSDPVVLNGKQIVSLNNTAAGAQTFSKLFDIALLKYGTNILSVSSSPSCAPGTTGVDDFEISNISIRLSK